MGTIHVEGHVMKLALPLLASALLLATVMPGLADSSSSSSTAVDSTSNSAAAAAGSSSSAADTGVSNSNSNAAPGGKNVTARDPQTVLDALAADSAGERHLLDNLKSADVRERVLGEFTFRTVTNPVIGDRGERLGTVMEWSQRTQEVRVEKELQQMLSAINGGKLGQRIDLAGKNGFFEVMARGINQLADNITTTVSMVKSAAEEIHRGAEEISEEDQNEIRALRGLESNPANGAPPTGGEAATWRFYCELTGA